MNLIKKLFNKYSSIRNTNKRFSIEYYPLTNRYYPKYDNYYLKTNWQTGIVETKEDYLFVYAGYGNTEEEAKKLIELFKEQQLKENVKTISL